MSIDVASSNNNVHEVLMKVPQITALFWVTKILNTFGETAGDALSMSLNLGYLLSNVAFILQPFLWGSCISKLSLKLIIHFYIGLHYCQYDCRYNFGRFCRPLIGYWLCRSGKYDFTVFGVFRCLFGIEQKAVFHLMR